MAFTVIVPPAHAVNSSAVLSNALCFASLQTPLPEELQIQKHSRFRIQGRRDPETGIWKSCGVGRGRFCAAWSLSGRRINSIKVGERAIAQCFNFLYTIRGCKACEGPVVLGLFPGDGFVPGDPIPLPGGVPNYESGEDIVEAGCPFECQNREIKPQVPDAYKDCEMSCAGATDFPYSHDGMVGPYDEPKFFSGNWIPQLAPGPQKPCSKPGGKTIVKEEVNRVHSDKVFKIDLRPACSAHDRCYGTCPGDPNQSFFSRETCDFLIEDNAMHICEQADNRFDPDGFHESRAASEVVGKCIRTASQLGFGTDAFGDKRGPFGLWPPPWRKAKECCQSTADNWKDIKKPIRNPNPFKGMGKFL